MLLNLFLCNNEVYMERYYIRGTIRSRRLGLYNYLSLHICPLWGYAWLDMTYAFQNSEPAGRTMAGPVILTMKYAFSKSS